MYVLGQDGVRPCCRDSHVSCTPKPVLCFGVRTASHIVWSKFKNSLFFKEEVVKWCTEYHIQGKTTPFLKNPECGTDAF